MAASVFLGVMVGGSSPTTAVSGSPTGSSGKLVFKSGKNPVPNKDKVDKTGTKKDKKFLKCLSGCKATCEQSTGGLAVRRADCVQDCQDQYCESYEQGYTKIQI